MHLDAVTLGFGTYVVNTRNLNLETLALPHLLHNLADLGGGVKRRTAGENLPVVKDRLREGLARGGLAEIGVVAERLEDGKVGLDGEERRAGTLLFGEDVTTSSAQDAVDTTHGTLGHLNLRQEDGLLEGGLGKEGSRIEDTASGRDDLATTTVDGISVQGHIHDVEPDSTHRLLSNGTLAGGPLETGNDRVLDFLQVLDGLGLVNQEVGTRGVGAESPDLASVGDVPAVFVGQDTGTRLEIVTRTNLATLNVQAELLGQGLGLEVDTVVLVGRLGQRGFARLGTNSLTVLDDGVGDDEGHTGVVVLEVVQANLQVKFTGTSNDVLARFRGVSQDARIRLGQTLEAFNELGQVLGVLDLDGALHDGRDGELHDLEVVSRVESGEGTRLEQELVNADKADNVTSGQVIDSLDLAGHHEDGTLDGLDEEVVLLAGDVVGALDADLETRPHGTRVDTAKGVEATLVGGGNHLGDVKHERTLGVAVTDTNGGFVVHGTLVQRLGTVLLGGNGGRKMENHHLQNGVGSGKEGAHDRPEQLLALLVTVLGRELELELLEEGLDLVVLEVHDRAENLEDGVQDELAEGTLELLALVGARLGPLLGGRVEVVVTLRHGLAAV